MSYYQGDYYEGDYYEGDPFIGALFGSAVGWLGKKLLGRGAKKAGTTAIARVGAGAMTGMAVGATGTAALATIPAMMNVGEALWARRTKPPQAANMTPGEPMFTTTAYGCAPGMACPSGFHPNKSISHAKATFGAAPGTICVRNRSMNVANSRALRRGLRRVSGFAKLAARARTTIKKAARTV